MKNLLPFPISSEGSTSTFVCDPPALCLPPSISSPFIFNCFLSIKWSDYSGTIGLTSKSWKSRRMAIRLYHLLHLILSSPEHIQLPWTNTQLHLLTQSPSGFAAASCDDRFDLCFPFLSLFLLLKEKKSICQSIPTSNVDPSPIHIY